MMTNIILTSEPHAGKTTACMKLAEKLKEQGFRVGGILCPDERVLGLEGGEMRFCTRDPDEAASEDVIRVGHCFIFRDAMEFAIDQLRRSAGRDVIFIDEYGPLEWRGEGLIDAIREVLPSKKCVVLVRRLLVDRFKKIFKDEKFKEYTLAPGNRDGLPEEMYGDISSER